MHHIILSVNLAYKSGLQLLASPPPINVKDCRPYLPSLLVLPTLYMIVLYKILYNINTRNLTSLLLEVHVGLRGSYRLMTYGLGVGSKII